MEKSTITVLSQYNVTEHEEEDERSMFSSFSSKKIISKSTNISTGVLSKSLEEFLTSFDEVLKQMPEKCGNYCIEELEISLTVDASGKIALVGEVAGGVTSSISIKLKR